MDTAARREPLTALRLPLSTRSPLSRACAQFLLEMPAELLEFLDEGEAPIVFTLGTSAVWVAKDFYRESIAAAKLLGRRAVLLIGDERNQIETLPPGMIAVNYAPFK